MFDVEKFNGKPLTKEYAKAPDMLPKEYASSALQEGLRLEKKRV